MTWLPAELNAFIVYFPRLAFCTFGTNTLVVTELPRTFVKELTFVSKRYQFTNGDGNATKRTVKSKLSLKATAIFLGGLG